MVSFDLMNLEGVSQSLVNDTLRVVPKNRIPWRVDECSGQTRART